MPSSSTFSASPPTVTLEEISLPKDTTVAISSLNCSPTSSRTTAAPFRSKRSFCVSRRERKMPPATPAARKTSARMSVRGCSFFAERAALRAAFLFAMFTSERFIHSTIVCRKSKMRAKEDFAHKNKRKCAISYTFPLILMPRFILRVHFFIQNVHRMRSNAFFKLFAQRIFTAFKA